MTVDEVLSANRAFYQAFAMRDVAAMDRVWASTAPVTCIHPGSKPLHGRQEVMASWHDILAVRDGPRIGVRDERAFLLGNVALVVCEEVLGAGVLVASNLFMVEDGYWRMIHHQAGPVAVMAAAKPTAPRPTVH